MPIDDRAAAEARSAADRIEAAQAEVDRARKEFQRVVRAVYLEGASMREIADALGISHQRVHQLLDLPKRDQGSQRRRRGTRDVFLCSFCGRKQTEVRKLFIGSGIFICDGCVALGRGLLDPANSSAFTESAYARLWLSSDTPRCSFCGKDNDVLHPDDTATVPLVTAGTHAAICGECLELCQQIVDEETADTSST